MARKYEKRDAEILKMRQDGATLKAISHKYGISQQRTLQIIRAEIAASNKPADELQLSGRAEMWVKLKLDFHGLGIEEGVTIDDLREFERRGHLSFKESGYNIGKKTIKEIASILAANPESA